MTDALSTQPIDSIISDLGVYARRLDDNFLPHLIHRLEDVLDIAATYNVQEGGSHTNLRDLSGSAGGAIVHGAQSFADQ